MRYFKSFLFLLVLVGFLGANEVKSKTSNIPMIVPVSWLKDRLNDSNLVIIDVRDEKAFKKGHIEHAINMPVFKDFFDKNYMLPKLNFLKELFGNAGISNDSEIVFYGNNQLIWAARGYWVSKVLGVNRAGLLSVGYGNWKKGDLPISTKIYTPKKRDFIPMVDDSILQTKLSTLMSVGRKIIIDGRPKDFYLGKKSHAKRFGHIPSALNYPGSGNYNLSSNGSSMKDFEALKELYKDLPKNKDIILYCEDGADAALNFVVLKKLGYSVSVYDGSWLEWGNDYNLPIDTPIKKK
jgi:thiosulfate/3-mercaptopyruvate sulfurtransferase